MPISRIGTDGIENGAVAPADLSTGGPYWDGSGNVGVGTSSPSVAANYKGIVVQGSTTSAGGVLQLQTSDSSYQAQIYTDSNGTTISSTGNYPMRFQTNGSERVRIDASGNLLINRTSVFNSERLGVTYSSNTGAGVVINDSTAQNGNTFIGFRNNGSSAGAITSNGTTTMTYGSASDYRLKENLAPLTGALAKIASLQPKVGNWKADGSEFVGFVAHELQEVFPDSVVGEKDKTDAEGNPEYQMVDTGSAAIIATLTAAIQELNAKVEAQAAEIAALKGAA